MKQPVPEIPLYKSRYDGTKIYAKKIGKFMTVTSILRGTTHGNTGDYIIRDYHSGDIYFLRAVVFEDEFERTRG